MQKMKRTLMLLILIGVAGSLSAYGSPILTLQPVGGAISGTPGAIIGWGFTLTNPDNNYAVITSADFCGGIISSPCSTPLGIFTDFIAQLNFTYLDPFGSTSGAFDEVNFTGIGSYTIDPAAAVGSSFSGQIVLTYDLYQDGPGATPISFGNVLTASASVLVTSGSVTPVPEPSAVALLSTGLIGLYVFGRRRTADTQPAT